MGNWLRGAGWCGGKGKAIRGKQIWALVLALPNELEQVLDLWESELGLEKRPAESGMFEKCALCLCVFSYCKFGSLRK